MPLYFDFRRRCHVCDKMKPTTRGCTHRHNSSFFICADCNARVIETPKTLKIVPGAKL